MMSGSTAFSSRADNFHNPLVRNTSPRANQTGWKTRIKKGSDLDSIEAVALRPDSSYDELMAALSNVHRNFFAQKKRLIEIYSSLGMRIASYSSIQGFVKLLYAGSTLLKHIYDEFYRTLLRDVILQWIPRLKQELPGSPPVTPGLVDPKDVAVLSLSLRNFSINDTELLGLFSEKTRQLLPDMSPLGLTFVASSFSQLGFRDEVLFAAIADSVLPDKIK